MIRQTISLLCATFACLIAFSANGSAATPPVPLGIPLPTNPSLTDLLSTSTKGGDVQGLPGAGACASAQHRPISLPADDAAHNGEAYIEFWWWMGHLSTPDGHRFAYMFWWASKPAEGIQWSDYTLTDLATHRFHYSREPLIVGQPKYIPDRFDLRGEQASATGGGGRDTIHFTVDGYQVNLRLRSIKTAVIELGDGFFTAYCNSSYFYSRDRMPTTGTITHDGKTERVSGTSDFDRQWGFNPALTVANTTGLFFRLPDGRDILLGLVRLRAYGNEVTFYLGSIQDASGHVTTLHRGDFTMTPTAYWRRDATCSYPVDWDVHVAGLHLHLRPTVEPEEVRAIRWPELFALWPEWPTYWDGEAAFTGDATGLGWEDLNKYCLV